MLHKSLMKLLGVFFVFQLIFSLFFEGVTEKQNIYPFYTWKIFHTMPEKYLTRFYVLIHELDGKSLTVPVDVLKAENLFKNMRVYTMARKINNIGWMKENPEFEKIRQENIAGINEALLWDHEKIRWELRGRVFDPIEYVLNQSVVKDYSVETFNVNK